MSQTAWSHGVSLPPDGRSASRSRAFVKGHLASHDLAALTEDVALVTSELATNAVRHAHTAFVLTLESDGESVMVAVRDDGVGATVEPSPAPGDSAVGGRGLRIVGRLSTDWGVAREPSSTRVWARFDVPPGRP